MKIFSLKTKKHLLGWGVILGILVNLIITFCTNLDEFSNPGFPLHIFKKLCEINLCEGFNFGIKDYFLLFFKQYVWQSMISNQVFWILLVLIILSLVRYFKYKNVQVKVG